MINGKKITENNSVTSQTKHDDNFLMFLKQKKNNILFKTKRKFHNLNSVLFQRIPFYSFTKMKKENSQHNQKENSQHNHIFRLISTENGNCFL